MGNGVLQSRKILKKFKPDLIIGTGGYVCFPVIFSGSKLGIPCYIHEQNAFPGLANRKLEKYVRKIYLGFKEGVMGVTEVMAAQTAWQQAQSQKIDAQIDVKLSQVGLQKALGTLY